MSSVFYFNLIMNLQQQKSRIIVYVNFNYFQWLKLLENAKVENNQSTIKVGKELFVVLKTGDVYSIPNGTFLNKLVINRATEEHNGMYICLGANIRGYTFKKAYLHVRPSKYN